MKRLIVSILALCLLTSFNIATTFAQLNKRYSNFFIDQDELLNSENEQTNKMLYRLKLQAGKQYYIQMITEQRISDPTPAQEGTAVMKIGTGAEFDVINIDSNGNAQVTYTYRWMEFGLKGPMDEQIYDSSKKDSPVPAMAQGFAALLEESFSLKITPKGRVSEIKGLDKVRSNIQRKLPPGPMQQFTMNSLNQWISEEPVKERIESSMAIYPDKPVGVGDSWSRNVVISREFTMILENKWTLKERKNGVAVIEVISTIKPNPQAKPKEVGLTKMSYEFTGKQQGLIEMQESTGLIINSKINRQISGQTIMATPGTPDKTIPMEIASVITIETSDWDKAKSIIGMSAVAGANAVIRRSTLTGQELIEANNSLFQAVIKGDVSQVNLLISKGADVNSKNRMGWSPPLHTAIQYRRQALIEPLIAKGADVNAKGNSGQTPLHIAVNTDQKDAVELLIANGADVNVMGSRGDNALALAKKRRNTEIVELLRKHGAKEPSPEDLTGNRYYGERGRLSPYQAYGEQGTIQRGTRAISQSPAAVDILADPNEIRVRVKTFEGLEKALDEVAGKSKSEMRHWQQKRYDNRTLLIKAVQKQFEDEIGFIRKAAVDEEAKKTTAAIDSMLPKRQERFKSIGKELLAQKRALRQTQQPTRGRGRARTSSRSARSRYPQRGQSSGGNITEPLYGRGGVMPGTNRYPGTTRGTSQQIDREAENERRQWLQPNLENRADLAKMVHEQIWVEISSVRNVAVEEEAKKTTAAIDGVLLYRQTRFEEFIRKMEEQRQALQQTQDPRIRGRGGYIQQQNQPRTRGRRR
jgi:hypothetical protein